MSATFDEQSGTIHLSTSEEAQKLATRLNDGLHEQYYRLGGKPPIMADDEESRKRLFLPIGTRVQIRGTILDPKIIMTLLKGHAAQAILRDAGVKIESSSPSNFGHLFNRVKRNPKTAQPKPEYKAPPEPEHKTPEDVVNIPTPPAEKIKPSINADTTKIFVSETNDWIFYRDKTGALCNFRVPKEEGVMKKETKEQDGVKFIDEKSSLQYSRQPEHYTPREAVVYQNRAEALAAYKEQLRQNSFDTIKKFLGEGRELLFSPLDNGLISLDKSGALQLTSGDKNGKAVSRLLEEVDTCGQRTAASLQVYNSPIKPVEGAAKDAVALMQSHIDRVRAVEKDGAIMVGDVLIFRRPDLPDDANASVADYYAKKNFKPYALVSPAVDNQCHHLKISSPEFLGGIESQAAITRFAEGQRNTITFDDAFAHYDEVMSSKAMTAFLGQGISQGACLSGNRMNGYVLDSSSLQVTHVHISDDGKELMAEDYHPEGIDIRQSRYAAIATVAAMGNMRLNYQADESPLQVTKEFVMQGFEKLDALFNSNDGVMVSCSGKVPQLYVYTPEGVVKMFANAYGGRNHFVSIEQGKALFHDGVKGVHPERAGEFVPVEQLVAGNASYTAAQVKALALEEAKVYLTDPSLGRDRVDGLEASEALLGFLHAAPRLKAAPDVVVNATPGVPARVNNAARLKYMQIPSKGGL